MRSAGPCPYHGGKKKAIAAMISRIQEESIMEDVTFTGTLSDEEIAKNFENIDFFSGIMAGLEEALAFEKGNAKELI